MFYVFYSFFSSCQSSRIFVLEEYSPKNVGGISGKGDMETTFTMLTSLSAPSLLFAPTKTHHMQCVRRGVTQPNLSALSLSPQAGDMHGSPKPPALGPPPGGLCSCPLPGPSLALALSPETSWECCL